MRVVLATLPVPRRPVTQRLVCGRDGHRRLPRNEITDKGAALLAELLKGSSLLTSLDVSGASCRPSSVVDRVCTSATVALLPHPPHVAVALVVVGCVAGNKITKVGSKALASALAANKHCTMRHLEGLRLVKFRKLFKTRIPRNQMNKKDNNMVFLKKLRHASGYHTDPVRSRASQQRLWWSGGACV